MPAHIHHPLRLDSCQRPRKQLGGLHNLRRHDKRGLFALLRCRSFYQLLTPLEHLRPRKYLHLPIPRPLVNIALFPPRHMPQQGR